MITKRTFIAGAIMFALFAMFPMSHVFASSEQEIQSKINRIEQQEKEMNKKKDTLKEDQANVQSKLNENKKNQAALEQEIKQIDEKLNSTKLEIDEKEIKINETNDRIEQLTEELEDLTKEIELITDRIEKREKLLKDRLRSIQENGGDIKFLEVLFGSQSFMDFINRSTAVNKIMGQDKKLIEENNDDKIALEKNEEQVKVSKAEVEDRKQALGEQKEELVALKDDLDDQVADKGKLLAQLGDEYNQLDEYRVSVEDEQKAVAAQSASLKKAKKLAQEEKARLKTLSQSQGGGSGIFIWPANGRRSSGYGARIHPIYKTKKIHHGLDIATPVGTPLKAAGTGVVSTARAMGGYGNVIMITHMVNGEQLTTVYAHLSKISVSSGQTVQQGQVIGATGNLGDSTGPHLHFEVHKGSWNGSRSNSTNPINYLP